MDQLKQDVGRIEVKQDQQMAEFRASQQAVSGMIEDVQAMKPHVEHYKKKKHWLAGFAAGIAAISGGISSTILKWF